MGDLAKVALDDVDEGLVVKVVVVDLGAEVDLAPRPELGVKAAASRRTARCGGSSGSGCGRRAAAPGTLHALRVPGADGVRK